MTEQDPWPTERAGRSTVLAQFGRSRADLRQLGGRLSDQPGRPGADLDGLHPDRLHGRRASRVRTEQPRAGRPVPLLVVRRSSTGDRRPSGPGDLGQRGRRPSRRRVPDRDRTGHGGLRRAGGRDAGLGDLRTARDAQSPARAGPTGAERDRPPDPRRRHVPGPADPRGADRRRVAGPGALRARAGARPPPDPRTEEAGPHPRIGTVRRVRGGAPGHVGRARHPALHAGSDRITPPAARRASGAASARSSACQGGSGRAPASGRAPGR